MRIVVAVVVTMCLALMALAERVRAHEWYPLACCSGVDCAPVLDTQSLPLSVGANLLGAPAYASSVLLVTTKHGTVAVPADFPRQQSPDGQMHACMRKLDDGSMRLLCLFLPPAS